MGWQVEKNIVFIFKKKTSKNSNNKKIFSAIMFLTTTLMIVKGNWSLVFGKNLLKDE